MDEKRHPDPRRFEPLRYKDDFLNLSDSATNPDVTKRDQFTFGAGKFSSPSAYFCLAGKPRPPYLPKACTSRNAVSFWACLACFGALTSPLPWTRRVTRLSQTRTSIHKGLCACPRNTPRSLSRGARKEQRSLGESESRRRVSCFDPVTKQWKEVPKGMKFRSVEEMVEK